MTKYHVRAKEETVRISVRCQTCARQQQSSPTTVAAAERSNCEFSEGAARNDTLITIATVSGRILLFAMRNNVCAINDGHYE